MRKSDPFSNSPPCGSEHISFPFILLMTCFSSQVDFTSCGGFLCIAAVLLMIIGIVTAVVLSFQYVRTLWSNPLICSLCSCCLARAAALKGLSVWPISHSEAFSCVTQQVPWLHMLYAAIGAIVYTLVSLTWLQWGCFTLLLQGFCWETRDKSLYCRI